MSATLTSSIVNSSSAARVATRLRPLRVAMFLQGIAPWVPVEKVFMTGIGFDAALVATMAAAYAVVVPILKIPSGILADRWSRRGVLMIAAGAGLASVVVGALSHNVATYIASAMILGIYFAMQSGTLDAAVYDTLLEELGEADSFERHYGRIQLLNSLALVGSALAGGVIAALVTPRMTYLVTIPCVALALVALMRFREPALHQSSREANVRAHVVATYRTVTRQRALLPVVLAMVLSAAMLQMAFEFGPLWLIALGASTVLFGPYTAGMTGALGLGGLLAGRLRMDLPGPAAGTAVTLCACGLTLVFGHSLASVIAAQIVLALLLVTLGIHFTRVLHDSIPSVFRAGVASGVSTLSWLTFLPCSLLFGVICRQAGVNACGWIVAALVTLAGTTVLAINLRAQTSATARVSTASEDGPGERDDVLAGVARALHG